MDRRIHEYTPALSCIDSRDNAIRRVTYHRADEQKAPQARVSLMRIDVNGQTFRQWDPRQSLHSGTTSSQQSLTSLSGRTLSSESRDAGWTLSLPGEAGETSETWDTRGNHWQTDYDELLRPVLIHETAAGQPGRVAERFTWSNVAGSNRRGRLVRHDDEAGTRLIKGYSLTGAEQEETRYLLPTLDLPDWPETLDPDSAANSTLRHSPLGELLERTDALGNRERSRFTLSGELAGSSLILADGTECLLLTDTRYNAFGQIESQTAGNGVISHTEYDPADGRLKRLSSNRPGRSKLQDLHYTYDPVGNVIRIEDHSQPLRHFANQRIDPVSTFAYDSLYQLTEATGREAAGATIGPTLPDLAPDPGDTSRLLNYRQLYEYDASGNLLSLQHIGQQSYTRVMSVAEYSNHAVPEPGDPLTSFDANGNLRRLSPGQPLSWNARNQLHSTRQVTRDEGESDEEHYRYGGDGLRVRKVITRRVSGRMQSSEVRYLPGLELHTRQGESFAVITAQAGRCAVRCLVWSEGQPGGIATPQLRYSLDDLHDSSGLELDGEANIISHEGYYPFGGTAWWAANSAIEASYKTRRYSGKERDSTGLYYYGLRYYAPWLMRWINPDPAGDIDGLNRYRFVRNNPLTLLDVHGLNPDDQFYTIRNFSRGRKAPASERLTASNGLPGVTLNASGAVADFAYNAVWSTRWYLDRGSGNDIGSAMNTEKMALYYGLLLRKHLPETADLGEIAGHALAARTGFCGEHARVMVALMSSSAQWPGSPIYLVVNPKHTYPMLYDPRVNDSLVADEWVTVPTLHNLSQSLNAHPDGNPFNYTPRMPGDPMYAMNRARIADLRERFYTPRRELSLEEYSRVIGEMVNRNKMYSQLSAMTTPQATFYRHDGVSYNAACVPETQWSSVNDRLVNSYDAHRINGLRERLQRL